MLRQIRSLRKACGIRFREIATDAPYKSIEIGFYDGYQDYDKVSNPEWSQVEYIVKKSGRPGDGVPHSFDLSRLRNLSSLKAIDLACDCDVYNLEHFSQGFFPDLTKLFLGYPKEGSWENVDFEALGRSCPNVKELQLKCYWRHKNSINSMAILPEQWKRNLTMLSVTGSSIRSLDGLLPHGGDTLPIKMLDLSNCNQLTSLAGINMPLLEKIHLVDTRIDEKELVALKSCSRLTHFTASHCPNLKSIEQLGPDVLQRLKYVRVDNSIADMENFAASLNPAVLEVLYAGDGGYDGWELFYQSYGHDRFPRTRINNHEPLVSVAVSD